MRVYRPAPPTLLLLASDAPIEPERQVDATRAAFRGRAGHYARLGLNVVEDLLAALAWMTRAAREFAGEAALITDDRNRFATASVFDFGRNLRAAEVGRLLARYDPLQDTGSYIYRELNGRIDYAYLGRRVGAYMQSDSNVRDRLNRYAALFRGAPLQAYLQAVILQNSLQPEQARQQLLTAAQAYPDSVLLRDALLDAWLGPLAAGTAPAAIHGLVQVTSEYGRLTLQGAAFATRGQWRELADHGRGAGAGSLDVATGRPGCPASGRVARPRVQSGAATADRHREPGHHRPREPGEFESGAAAAARREYGRCRPAG